MKDERIKKAITYKEKNYNETIVYCKRRLISFFQK